MSVKRFNPDINVGLNVEEVTKRYESNLVNFDPSSKTKSFKKIILENVFTLFNIINIILSIAIILVGSYKNLAFMIIIILNTLISIIQEYRSKKTLDKLKVISEAKVKVRREGIDNKLNLNEIVLDDIIILEAGNQVVVDTVIKSGEAEVDESFITGESETVYKKTGDMILSGSFIVSGNVIGQVEHIGNDNYTSKIVNDTKYIKAVSSEIMNALNKIVSTISMLIVPIAILLFYRQLYLEDSNITNAVVNTVAALIGMIPEGLVLLTSTVLAVSVIKLSRRNVLVHDLYCIETLARVDVVCLDKTGTITEGCMEVVEEKKESNKNIGSIITTICTALNEENPTAKALKEYYHSELLDEEIIKNISFSSKRKYSGIVTNKKTYVMGAPEFILKEKIDKYRNKIDKYTKEYRVICVCEADNAKLENVHVLGFVLLRDKIRPEAPATLNYFKEQGVTIKIISGDNPNTVLNIAKRAGMKEDIEMIDATTLKTDEDIMNAVERYTVFGRVTPEQKKEIVIALQNHGHTVAMTGDGVNDVLALKEADCSIAMSTGSDATKNVSQLVLLDSNFSSMPEIVKEGRRTINNIERSASLFLVKTVYASILALLFIFIKMPYPFIPIQLTLASVSTIGIPSFILSFEPNNERVTGKFLPNVLKKAVPPAITIVINILIIIIISSILKLTYTQTSTLSVLMTGYTSFILLFKVCQPFNMMRKCLFGSMFLLFVFGIIKLKTIFSFSSFTLPMIFTTILCIITSHYFYNLIEHILKKALENAKKMQEEKRKTLLKQI